MTLIYRDARFLLHKTGAHPECPQRLTAIHSRLERSGLLQRCSQQDVVLAGDDDILRVHSERHLDSIRKFSKAGGGRIEVDTVMSPESAEVAILAAVSP